MSMEHNQHKDMKTWQKTLASVKEDENRMLEAELCNQYKSKKKGIKCT